MATLSRDLRRVLERTVLDARLAAEAGARKALEALSVGHHEPHTGLTPEQRTLRNRLRAHGRQLGDKRDEKRGIQSIDRLVAECAYQHWHRMLFARFLAENALLIEPESGMDITLEDCQALAREQSRDWLELAAEYAQRMLPQIFRTDDPVLAAALPAETQQALEALLKDLSTEIFTADDSLGWVYQFWQSEQKDAVNKSGKKIGAEELPAVTQLFTEDYMVWFLLHNTLGAWWAGKACPDGIAAGSEEEARKAVALPGVSWDYLRFLKGEDGKWRPAAGTFEGWPKTAKKITVLDPCMGSGHFLVFALPILVDMRRAEESTSRSDAVFAVLRDNLFGLEIDPRCTQLAAFNLALAAWKLGGYQALPSLNLACSGLAPYTREAGWLALAESNEKLRNGMERLHRLFKDAPVLGSLINPRHGADDMYVADYHELRPLLEKAFAQETGNDTVHEMAVTARGLAKAAEMLASEFTLVATNVPYLGRGKQAQVLQDYCERVHPLARADLATCFVERCLEFCKPLGTTALVTPQNWLSLGIYKDFRQSLLRTRDWYTVVRLGAKGFQTPMWDFNVALFAMGKGSARPARTFAGFDVSNSKSATDKAVSLAVEIPSIVDQLQQLRNPDSRLSFSKSTNLPLLQEYADGLVGIQTADDPRYSLNFWETSATDDSTWSFFQGSPVSARPFEGLCWILRWEQGRGSLQEMPNACIRALHAIGQRGVMIARMAELHAHHYLGTLIHQNAAFILPHDPANLSAIWAFCVSPEYNRVVRELDQSLKVTNATLVKVPFDLEYWKSVAAKQFHSGLPRPHTNDPTQWLFNGHPKSSERPLQVAVARLLGYRWPRQTGSEFMDCPALGPDGLESHADGDGIVCLPSIKGEDSAADRLRSLLSAAYGEDWNAAQLNRLLSEVGFAGRTLDDWLRDGFFEQHSALFHHRPFIWHIGDGRRDGFQALVNYHRLVEGKGKGRKLLEKLTYAYLGDWIDRQRADQKAGVEGADGRLAAAEHLQSELKHILEGEPPYDLFVRWKPLHQQPIGWEPDINDGVRLNIRPFMTARPLGARGKNACILRVTPKTIKWTKDRGKEASRERADYPWFWGWNEEAVDFEGGKTFDGHRWNDLHYTRAAKEAARQRHEASSARKRRAH